jgi:hypothetical protein
VLEDGMTKKSTAEKKLEELREVKQALYEKERDIDKLLGTGGSFITAIDNMESLAVKRTAESIGVEVEALEWFIYENNWGARKFECSRDGKKMVKMDSIKAFLKFEGIK